MWCFVMARDVILVKFAIYWWTVFEIMNIEKYRARSYSSVDILSSSIDFL